MKKLLLLFILTPILSVAQVDTDAYKVKSPYSTEKKTTEVKQEVNISNEKSAAVGFSGAIFLNACLVDEWYLGIYADAVEWVQLGRARFKRL